jgi:hypothetical protein
MQTLVSDCHGACSNQTIFGQVPSCTAACVKLIQKGCISKSATPPAGAKGKPLQRALFKSDALKAYAYVNAKAQLLTCADVAAVMGAHANDFLTQHLSATLRDYPLNKVGGGACRLHGPPARGPGGPPAAHAHSVSCRIVRGRPAAAPASATGRQVQGRCGEMPAGSCCASAPAPPLGLAVARAGRPCAPTPNPVLLPSPACRPLARRPSGLSAARCA